LPYVLAVKPSRGTWAPIDALHTPEEAARALRWDGPDAPGDWTPVVRRYRDGHEETWWAAELRLAGYGPDRPTRMIVATTAPAGRRPRRGRRRSPCPRRTSPRAGGKMGTAPVQGAVVSSWPQALRRVRGWLDPWTFLWRCWRAWSTAPPPSELQALLDAVADG